MKKTKVIYLILTGLKATTPSSLFDGVVKINVPGFNNPN